MPADHYSIHGLTKQHANEATPGLIKKTVVPAFLKFIFADRCDERAELQPAGDMVNSTCDRCRDDLIVLSLPGEYEICNRLLRVP